MSMDCDEDNDNDHACNPSLQSTQHNDDNMMMKDSPRGLKPIAYSDSMDLDTSNNNRKPRTLFSLLLNKRRQSSRNRKKRRLSNGSSNDIHDKLTKEELRVVKDLKEISDSKWCARGTIVTIHLSIRLHNFKCTISPAEGYYRDGTFSFDISIDKNYPYSPPQIRACHPIFHPNINMKTFAIGLPILSPSDWKAVLSLNDVLFALQLLFMQPNIDGIDTLNEGKKRQRMKANGYHRNHKDYGFGVNNHKPAYIPNICYQGTTTWTNTQNSVAIIQNMEAALMFRDNPRQFEKISQQIIKGGVNLFGTNWQCVERKKMKNIFVNNHDAERYDPSLGSQTFRLKDSDTMITKKCSVLRKRKRNESEHDTFSMENVTKVLRCFASSTGSMKDGIYSDSSESQTSLINGVDNIHIEPPEKKRKIDTNGLAASDVHGFSFRGNGIQIVQHNNGYAQNIRDQDALITFDFPWNKNQNETEQSQYDDDFNMN